MPQSRPAPANHKHDHEYQCGDERNEGPFDETDIELPLGNGKPYQKTYTFDTALKVIRYCSILFLGLVTIATTLHVAHSITRARIESWASESSGYHGSSEDRAPPRFHQGYTTQHQRLTVPDYPPGCDQFGCQTHIAPGHDTRPIPTITIVKGPPEVTATSPPICVPPHCYPHPPPGHHHQYHKDDDHHHHHDGDETDPPRVTATSPPICVPPHCYPHPPPGHHDPDHHHDGHDTDPPRVTATSPPICVSLHCYPHPPTGHRHTAGEEYEGYIVHEQENDIPPPCYPPHCYPPPLQSFEDDARHEVESADSPPICVPPHCYPHKSDQHVHDEHVSEVVDETPPICVQPHSHPHTAPNVPLESHDQIDIDRPETEQQGTHDQDESPPICVPPHCYPHTQEDDPHILVDQNQSGGLKVENADVKSKPDEDEEKPICTSPI